MITASKLPNDISALKALLVDSEDRNVRKDDRIERLEKLVAEFKRALFGSKSEKVAIDQYELALEDIETAIAASVFITLREVTQSAATIFRGWPCTLCYFVGLIIAQRTRMVDTQSFANGTCNTGSGG